MTGDKWKARDYDCIGILIRNNRSSQVTGLTYLYRRPVVNWPKFNIYLCHQNPLRARIPVCTMQFRNIVCTMGVARDIHRPCLPNIIIIIIRFRPRCAAWRLVADLSAGHAEDSCKGATKSCFQEYSHRWQTCADNARWNFDDGPHVSLRVEPCGIVLAQDKHWEEKAGHSCSAITGGERCIRRLICTSLVWGKKKGFSYKRPNAKIRDRAIFCGFGSWIFHTLGIGINQTAKSLMILTIA